jgi:hypothetical protein
VDQYWHVLGSWGNTFPKAVFNSDVHAVVPGTLVVLGRGDSGRKKPLLRPTNNDRQVNPGSEEHVGGRVLLVYSLPRCSREDRVGGSDSPIVEWHRTGRSSPPLLENSLALRSSPLGACHVLFLRWEADDPVPPA